MSSDPRIILGITPAGSGWALDLGGRHGLLKPDLERLGYCYVNVDLAQASPSTPNIVADAHQLPIRGGSISLVVSKDSLEHFREPWLAIQEIHRVLAPGGALVVYVPFMYGFHSTDYYRYTPLGLRYLLREFAIETIESPEWVLSIAGTLFVALLNRLGLPLPGTRVGRACRRFDYWLRGGLHKPASLAGGYRILARKRV